MLFFLIVRLFGKFGLFPKKNSMFLIAVSHNFARTSVRCFANEMFHVARWDQIDLIMYKNNMETYILLIVDLAEFNAERSINHNNTQWTSGFIG